MIGIGDDCKYKISNLHSRGLTRLGGSLICDRAGNIVGAKPTRGLPENKKAIATAYGAGAPTYAYSECITFCRAELLSSMARASRDPGRNPTKRSMAPRNTT